MAHTKNHDYHIINPSIWPLMAAGAAFVDALRGGQLDAWRHALAVRRWGFVATLYVMFGWWADVVAESNAGEPTRRSCASACATAFIMFIMSEVMFFAAWFWAFCQARALPR